MFRHFKPGRVRPDMPNFGVRAGETAGMLEWDWVERRLESARHWGKVFAAPLCRIQFG